MTHGLIGARDCRAAGIVVRIGSLEPMPGIRARCAGASAVLPAAYFLALVAGAAVAGLRRRTGAASWLPPVRSAALAAAGSCKGQVSRGATRLSAMSGWAAIPGSTPIPPSPALAAWEVPYWTVCCGVNPGPNSRISQLPLTFAAGWWYDSVRKINRLRQFRPESRPNVGLGGCGPPQPRQALENSVFSRAFSCPRESDFGKLANYWQTF